MAHDSLEANRIKQDGTLWFFGAGILAILFAIFLYRVDWGLSNWDVEADRAKIIGELRQAQTSLPSSALDPRIEGQRNENAAAGSAKD